MVTSEIKYIRGIEYINSHDIFILIQLATKSDLTWDHFIIGGHTRI